MSFWLYGRNKSLGLWACLSKAGEEGKLSAEMQHHAPGLPPPLCWAAVSLLGTRRVEPLCCCAVSTATAAGNSRHQEA